MLYAVEAKAAHLQSRFYILQFDAFAPGEKVDYLKDISWVLTINNGFTGRNQFIASPRSSSLWPPELQIPGSRSQKRNLSNQAAYRVAS